MLSHTNETLSPRPFTDVAEHRSILKNNQNTLPRFSITPKTGTELSETVFYFFHFDIVKNIFFSCRNNLLFS